MKLKCLLLSALMALSLCACGGAADAPAAEEPSLLERGYEVIDLMTEIIRSEDYLASYTSDPDLGAILSEVAAGDFTAPKAVYAITPTAEILTAYQEMVGLTDLSDSLTDVMNARLLQSFVTQITAANGASSVAAMSICTAGKTFVSSELTEDVIYLYTYEAASPAAVVFSAGEDGAVSASGSFLLNEDFPCGSAEEVGGFFEGFEITELPLN